MNYLATIHRTINRLSLAAAAAVTFGTCPWTLSDAFGFQFGVEVEYASEHLLQPSVDLIPEAMYKAPLKIVKEVLGDPEGTITIRKWEKHPERNTKSAVYLDPKGREWQVVPESVNTTGLDGFELVTPPLQTEEDVHLVQSILHQIATQGEYGKGIRSSVHVTVDVSELYVENGDASRLTDTILFIESHWPEIYSALSPTRYGTIVNRFSVPLASNQKRLLSTIGKLSPDERTFPRLKEIFEEFQTRELELNQGSAHRAWKYRAANYKKLFGLNGEVKIPVIEFRIMDFGDSEDVILAIRLFQKIIEKAHSLERNSTFRNPFSDLDSCRNYSELNQTIFECRNTEYETFLLNLGLNPSDYLKLKRVKTPLSLEENQKLLKTFKGFDPSSPIQLGEERVTFGWEAEMFPSGANKVIRLTSASPKVRIERFPFLDGTYSEEETGNHEVRSIPTPILADAIEQMNTLADTLGDDLAGFHLHFRVPKFVTDQIAPEQLQGWLSRISDEIYAWRLENRRHYYALNTWSQTRRPPFSLKARGTLRVKEINGKLDIEIRGFMNDTAQIEKVARQILSGFLNPNEIQGFYDAQCLLNFQAEDLVGTMQTFIEKYDQRQLTPEEIELLVDLNQNATQNGIIPLFNFEYAPYLSDLEKQKIQDANFEFRKSVRKLLHDVIQNQRYEPESDELYKQFRWLVKNWAKSAEFYNLLEKSIFVKDANRSALSDREFIRKMIKASISHDESIQFPAKRLLTLTSAELLMAELETSSLSGKGLYRQQCWTFLMDLMLNNPSPGVRRQAADLVQKLVQKTMQEIQSDSENPSESDPSIESDLNSSRPAA